VPKITTLQQKPYTVVLCCGVGKLEKSIATSVLLKIRHKNGQLGDKSHMHVKTVSG